MIDVELIGAPAFSVSVAGDVFTSAAINRRLTGLIGCDPADFVGQTPQTMLLPGHAEEALVHYRRCVADRTAVDFDIHCEAPGGGRWWHTTLSPVLEGGDGRVGALIGVRVDITPRKLAERRAREVNSRIALAEVMVARARGKGDGFGLVLLDLDRFKPINDTHGHAVCDAVLREVAARLRRHLRPGDVAARLGGDEFAVLVAGATDDILAGLSRRLVEAVGRPVATAAGRIEIGGSVGAALWRDADRTLAELAERADAALFAVKRAGRSAWLVAA